VKMACVAVSLVALTPGGVRRLEWTASLWRHLRNGGVRAMVGHRGGRSAQGLVDIAVSADWWLLGW
jgi:hypothetical protein